MLKLPPSVSIDQEISKLSKAAEEKMKIAFRYQNLPTATTSRSKTMYGHNFDLEKTVGEDVIRNSDIEYWNPASDNGTHLNTSIELALKLCMTLLVGIFQSCCWN